MASAKAGASTVLCGAVGSDGRLAAELVQTLVEAGVDTNHVLRVEDVPTGTALITVDATGQNSVVVVSGANGHVGPQMLSGVQMSEDDVLVAQCEIPIRTVRAFFEVGAGVGATCILNAAPVVDGIGNLLSLCDILVVNESELVQLSGRGVDGLRADWSLSDARERLEFRGFSGVLVATLGSAGASAAWRGGTVQVPGHKVAAVDATGAGDCFVGCMAAALSRGSSLEAAMRFANAAAALSVQTAGASASMPRQTEIVEWMERADGQ